MSHRFRLEKTTVSDQLHHCNARAEKRGTHTPGPLFAEQIAIRATQNQLSEYLLSLPQFPAAH
jgi:hypothetical protein